MSEKLDLKKGESVSVSLDDGTSHIFKISEIGEPGIIFLENDELKATADFNSGYLDWEGKKNIVTAANDNRYTISLATDLIERLSDYPSTKTLQNNLKKFVKKVTAELED